ncbi:LysR substrate binding domain protein [compost metagenome]
MQVRIRAEGFDGMIRMVAHGAGIAIVPKAAIDRRPPEPSYQCVPLQEAWAHRALLLCARNFNGLPAYAMALARHLAD